MSESDDKYDEEFLTRAEIAEERSVRRFEAEEQERAGRRHERHHEIAAAEEARLLKLAEFNRQQMLLDLERVRRSTREYLDSLALGGDIYPRTGRE